MCPGVVLGFLCVVWDVFEDCCLFIVGWYVLCVWCLDGFFLLVW